MAVDPRTPPPQTPAADGIVCPFCAHVRGVREAQSACPKCTMEDTLNTRRSTGERIGPWFVLQRKNPTAPGLRFNVLLTLARRGHVTPQSIVRGPTTGQLWRFASEVKGLSRLFGVCWHCKASVSPDATTCPRCKSAQEIPDDPDVFLESQSSLPLMRELSPEPAANDGRLPGPRRESPARRMPAREAAGLDDLADLNRALATSRPAEQATPRAGRRNGMAEFHAAGMAAGGEPILSASDLATAFQLDAPRPGTMTRTRRALWKLTKAAAVIALIVGAAGAIIAYAKPSWRQMAIQRSQPFLDEAAGWWNGAYAVVVGSPPDRPAPPDPPTQMPTETRKPARRLPPDAKRVTAKSSDGGTGTSGAMPPPTADPAGRWHGFGRGEWPDVGRARHFAERGGRNACDPSGGGRCRQAAGTGRETRS